MLRSQSPGLSLSLSLLAGPPATRPAIMIRLAVKGASSLSSSASPVPEKVRTQVSQAVSFSEFSRFFFYNEFNSEYPMDIILEVLRLAKKKKQKWVRPTNNR
jgi:hypothetical protein